ncbi:maleylpyruvate isomerase family mycothiol-dependent enzyme [Amycolatopsis jejuensis]|uniref:maleylpyruvate isomerase family mycothiol-dependent enzyme n=1 Tax=Amycolatopsis jejuensis TaxID=330084 RepID=UPI0005275909|nr:maleylpyruvate isomerase family mycothiol-dependent enzyme [Amycolatopsis jejuensis]
MNVRTLAREERADFADLLDTLTPEQWEMPSLCVGWTVREVVAHAVSYDELGARGLTRRLARARLSLSRANALGLAEYRVRPPQELVAVMRRNPQPRGLLAAFGGMIGFVDGLIHQQDIRRPLGLPRTIPEVRLKRVLRLALVAPPVGAAQRLRGLRAIATDLDWSAGKGTEVRGPAEALLLSLAGRRAAVADLTGPGVPMLAARTVG